MKNFGKRRALWKGAFGVLTGLVFLAGAAKGPAEESNAAKIEATRTALEKWVETRKVISEEKKDFALAKETLQARIELVEHEIGSLREKIAEANKSIEEAEKKKAELVAQNDSLKNASSALLGNLEELENNTKRLLTQLPDPIREKVKPLSQRLPKDGEETELTLSQRFQNVIGILNEVNKFNREITVTSEVRDLPDGTTAEVTALYLGLGQAYYSGAKGSIAGIGTLSDEGWVWKPANEHAAAIAQAIAIMKNEQVATFVEVPVEIQ